MPSLHMQNRAMHAMIGREDVKTLDCGRVKEWLKKSCQNQIRALFS